MTPTPLEQRCLEQFRRTGDCWPEPGRCAEEDAWVQFALAAVLHAGRLVRALRPIPLSGEAAFKDDSSPVTEQEHEIEWMIRGQLTDFCPEATFMGEESGGAVSPDGISVAVDPVDGTWALLNRMNTFGVVIAVFRDGKPILGAVANPATGEIGYAVGDRRTRLIQLDLVGEHDIGVDLPLDRVKPGSVLVNVHPSRKAGPLAASMMAAWQSDEIQMLRMEGGSPAVALLEAAKGSFAYINLWDKRRSEPFDLAAGVMLVRNAGGRATDLAGEDIDCSAHAGPFVASIGMGRLDNVISTAREAISM
jgi:myo-inositol-1(or 4)-monophosphatase